MISWHSGRASAVRQRSRYRWRSIKVVRRKPRLATRLIKERGPVSTEVKDGGICFDGALWLPKSARAWAHSWQNSSAKGRSRMTARGRASLRFRALTRFLSWRNDMDSPLGLVAKAQAGNFDFPAISAIFAHFRPFRVVGRFGGGFTGIMVVGCTGSWEGASVRYVSPRSMQSAD